MNPDIIGWAASIILLATLIRQVVKQARGGNGTGVSKWLFIGQCMASLGFIVYSVLVDNWVFIVTNACILATAIAGQLLRPKEG